MFSTLCYYISGDSIISVVPPKPPNPAGVGGPSDFPLNRLLPPPTKDPLETLALGSRCLPTPATPPSVPGHV